MTEGAFGIPRRSALRALLAGAGVAVGGGCAAPQPPRGGVFDVKAFGARGDGRTVDAGAIQGALDAAAEEGAGVVWLPPGRYWLGGDRLVLRSGVTLKGAGVDWAHDPTGGAQLVYGGRGAAVLAQNVKHVSIEDLLLDFRSTDETGEGIHLNGAWLSTLRNLRIISAGRHTYNAGIRIDTNGPTWGAQHLHLERLEVPNSTVVLQGNGPNDQVTTTVLQVIRGLRYDIDWATSLTMIDTTAENFTDVGIRIDRADQVTLLGVDIEGPGEVGLELGERVRSLAALGLSFIGFTGRSRIRGRPLSGMLVSTDEPVTFWGPVVHHG